MHKYCFVQVCMHVGIYNAKLYCFQVKFSDKYQQHTQKDYSQCNSPDRQTMVFLLISIDKQFSFAPLQAIKLIYFVLKHVLVAQHLVALCFVAANRFLESELHMVFAYLLFQIFTELLFKQMTLVILKTTVVCWFWEEVLLVYSGNTSNLQLGKDLCHSIYYFTVFLI